MLPAPDACAFAFAANKRTAKQRTSAQRLAGFMFQKREIARQEGLASVSTGLPICRNLYILSLLICIFQASLKAAEAGFLFHPRAVLRLHDSGAIFNS
jgi:hypothetical protein